MTSDQVNAAIDARRAYQREWRARNKDKVRQHNTNYWVRKVEKMKVQQKEGGVDYAQNANTQ